MIVIPGSYLTSIVRYPISTDSTDIILNVPNIELLSRLDDLYITVETSTRRYTINTDGLCSLTNLRLLDIHGATVQINDPACIALSNLRIVEIHNSNFVISPDIDYTNVIEMFSDYSPDLVNIEITGTNIEGSTRRLFDLIVDLHNNPGLDTNSIDHIYY